MLREPVKICKSTRSVRVTEEIASHLEISTGVRPGIHSLARVTYHTIGRAKILATQPILLEVNSETIGEAFTCRKLNALLKAVPDLVTSRSPFKMSAAPFAGGKRARVCIASRSCRRDIRSMSVSRSQLASTKRMHPASMTWTILSSSGCRMLRVWRSTSRDNSNCSNSCIPFSSGAAGGGGRDGDGGGVGVAGSEATSVPRMADRLP